MDYRCKECKSKLIVCPTPNCRYQTAQGWKVDCLVCPTHSCEVGARARTKCNTPDRSTNTGHVAPFNLERWNTRWWEPIPETSEVELVWNDEKREWVNA